MSKHWQCCQGSVVHSAQLHQRSLLRVVVQKLLLIKQAIIDPRDNPNITYMQQKKNLVMLKYHDIRVTWF